MGSGHWMETADGYAADLAAAFGHALRRKRRNDMEISQDALAERSGLSANRISEIESGKCDPKLSTMARLASAVGLELPTMLRTESGGTG